MTQYKLFESVTLVRDIPKRGLRAGDVGTVVEVHDDSGVIAEFLDEAGAAVAVIDLAPSDIRLVSPEDEPRAVRSEQKGLTHLDADGRPRMVDVSHKPDTAREATAKGSIYLNAITLAQATSGEGKKGDVLTTAQLAGIMAAKRTHELIPLCHPLPITGIDMTLEPDEERGAIDITATVRTTGKTGVEMEALTAVSVAALTVYDMIKATQKDARIGDIRLVRKTGGKSGDLIFE
jgi:cyclic pyranopterin phosphate synthase